MSDIAPSSIPFTNPNHHLWRNGRLWWIAITVHHDGWRQERVRRSLGTSDLDAARRRRDALLDEYRGAHSCVLAIRDASRAQTTAPDNRPGVRGHPSRRGYNRPRACLSQLTIPA